MLTNRADMLSAAVRANASGRLEESKQIARSILSIDENDVEALVLLGIVAVKQSSFAEASEILTRAIRIDPSSSDAPFWLSMGLRGLGEVQSACDMAMEAVRRNDRNEHAHHQLGTCLLDLQRYQEAESAFRRAIAISPKLGSFYDGLGRSLQAQGRIEEAIVAFRAVLEIGPVRLPALFRLGDAYMTLPDPESAAQCARTMLRIDPNSAQANLLMSRALIADGQVEEGAVYAKRAIELSPNNAIPVAYYGRALQSLGRMEEANEQFHLSIDLEPRQGFAYHALVHNQKVREEHRPLVDKMRELALDAGLPRRETIQLEYGLGKALEDLGSYAEAMEHFDRANRIDHELKVGVAPFDREQLKGTADFLLEVFNERFFKLFGSLGEDSDLPIFVVGMMRSGTTLAEQILSSHSEVGAAGEQLFWPENAGSSEKVFRRATGIGLELDVERLQTLAKAYIQLLTRIAPGKAHVVDKMNTNYLLLGLLHIAYPNARIIHMRRHPIDTCLSIWATPVANGIDLCASKENVVFIYRQYLRVMEHWRQVLPADKLLDVSYEELVNDRERVTRQMVDFCGLDWDESCMSPENNERSVRTPSVWQVRQPVYKTSMARWKKYEDHLGSFAELFDVSPSP